MKHLAINILRNAWLPIPPSSRVDKGMHIYIEIYIYFKKDFFWGTKRFRRARFPRYISFHVLHLCSVSNQVVSECYCIFLKLQVDIKLQYSQQHYGSTHGSSSKGCWMQKASLNLIRVFKPNAMHIDYAGKLFFAAKVPSSWISLYAPLCTASLSAPFSCWEGQMATGEPDPLFTFHCADYTVKNNTTAGYCLHFI